MADHAAFLRGINVSGRRVTGEQLCDCLEGLGLEEVRTFRASGNLVFGGAAGEAALERALAAGLGYEVAVFLRAAGDVRAIAAHEPFDAGVVAAAKGKLQVTFLKALPPAAKRKEVLARATDDDRLAFGERELYWLPSGGTQQSALGMKEIDRLLGPNTMRTMGTVEQLAAKFF
jgi:uncharacterized protein (DUF1697 family)